MDHGGEGQRGGVADACEKICLTVREGSTHRWCEVWNDVLVLINCVRF